MNIDNKRCETYSPLRFQTEALCKGISCGSLDHALYSITAFFKTQFYVTLIALLTCYEQNLT